MLLASSSESNLLLKENNLLLKKILKVVQEKHTEKADEDEGTGHLPTKPLPARTVHQFDLFTNMPGIVSFMESMTKVNSMG